MIKYFLGHYAYWFTLALMIIGLYGMTMKRNLVKKIIGMSIVQVAVILFYVNCGVKWGASIPIVDPAIGAADSAKYINPLPHCLMLTAIVVGVATTGVAFALVITIWKRYKTLDESQLLERMKKENELPG